MFQTTIAELAKNLGVEYPVAANLVKLMESQGKAKSVGLRPPPGGKGRSSTVYEFSDTTFTLDLQNPIPSIKVVEAV